MISCPDIAKAIRTDNGARMNVAPISDNAIRVNYYPWHQHGRGANGRIFTDKDSRLELRVLPNHCTCFNHDIGADFDSRPKRRRISNQGRRMNGGLGCLQWIEVLRDASKYKPRIGANQV